MAPRDRKYEASKERELRELVKRQFDGDVYVVSPVCNFCAHLYDFMLRTCSAYPRGIPDDIFRGHNLHSSPYPGDGGVQFEFRLTPYLAPPDSQARLAIRSALESVVGPLGFAYHVTSDNFYRSRGDLTEMFFYYIHRRDSFAIGIGMDAPELHGRLPQVDTNAPYSPMPLAFRWLAHQRWYPCTDDPQVNVWIGDFANDFKAEAIPWFMTFNTVADVEKHCPAVARNASPRG